MPGDIFLLCSDGLYDMVTDKQLNEILNESTVEQGACERLIKEALCKGGKDNITVVLVGVE